MLIMNLRICIGRVHDIVHGFFSLFLFYHNLFYVSNGKETKDLCQVSSAFVGKDKKLWVVSGARWSSRVWKWF
jgi:hypothetical protein